MTYTFRPAVGNFQSNQGTQTVACNGGLLHAQCVQQGQHGLSGLFDRLRCVARTFAMARQVNGQDVVAVVGKVAALQNPNAMVIECTMNENHGRALGCKRFATGVGVQLSVGEGNEHLEFLVKQRNAPIVPNCQVWLGV